MLGAEGVETDGTTNRFERSLSFTPPLLRRECEEEQLEEVEALEDRELEGTVIWSLHPDVQ